MPKIGEAEILEALKEIARDVEMRDRNGLAKKVAEYTKKPEDSDE